MASSSPCACDLRRVYPCGQICETARARPGAAGGGAGGGLEAAWQEAVFALYLAEDKIEPEVVENMRTWHGHRRAAMVGGFSVDQSVLLPAGDRAGIERLVQYMTRCPPEFVPAGEDQRIGSGGLQGREGLLPLLSRPGWRRPAGGRQAELSDPLAAGFPGAASPANWARSTSPPRDLT